MSTDQRAASHRVRPPRIETDPESVERGLVTLVLTLVELLRQLMERQALRRVEDGTLTEDKIDEIGRTLMALDDRMTELTDHFGLNRADLNLDLGPSAHFCRPSTQASASAPAPALHAGDAPPRAPSSCPSRVLLRDGQDDG